MKKWEYLCVEIWTDDKDLESQLGDYGKKGWEAFQIEPIRTEKYAEGGFYTIWSVMFKRQKK